MDDKTPLIAKEKMDLLQGLALAAMVCSLLGGDHDLFTGAIGIMFCLKTIAMFMYEDAREAIFAAIYLGFFVSFFFDLF
tara:strand:- start:5738 stop:5974 length:237 start_codon:yes stop_codon:yes gene_type:complete